jgi:hypothetical protein
MWIVIGISGPNGLAPTAAKKFFLSAWPQTPATGRFKVIQHGKGRIDDEIALFANP